MDWQSKSWKRLFFSKLLNSAPEDAPDVMGTIAAGAQIASLAGGIYEIVSVLLYRSTKLVLNPSNLTSG